MHARVSTFEGSPEKVDELSRYATEQVVRALKQMDGYAGSWASPTAGAARYSP